MIFPANGAAMNIVVTVGVAMLVLLLPFFDRRVCEGLGVNPAHGLYGWSRENWLLRLRMFVLYIIFGVYLAANVYIVFFSRSASADYLIHVDPLNDLINSVKIDSGLLGALTTAYTHGFSEGFSQVHIEKPEDIAQIYLNVMLYVPMGYLLPYVFDWCRRRVKIRPVVVCFVLSFITENLQLVFKRGFYDVDDLLANTLGGLIGQGLFISFAYVVTHPEWRRDLESLHLWRKMSRTRTLYPFAKQLSTARATLYVADPENVEDFYISYMGFRPRKKLVHKETGEIRYLLQIGTFQVEVICPPDGIVEGEQTLTMSVENIAGLRRRLKYNGFDPGEYMTDPYTDERMLKINAPEGVTLCFLEA